MLLCCNHIVFTMQKQCDYMVKALLLQTDMTTYVGKILFVACSGIV